MSRTLITRREAISLLLKILNTSNLDSEEDRKLQDIIHCIEAELENYHEWGGDTSEAVILHFPPDSKQVRSIDREELKRIYKKYRFFPSESDKDETNNEIKQMLAVVDGLGAFKKEDDD